MPSVALHPRHHRGDPRQVNLVEAVCQSLVSLVQGRLAMRAPGWASGDSLVRCLGQQAATALAAKTALTGTAPGRFIPAVRLLALRWRQAGVVGRLRRQAEPGFQLPDPGRQHGDLCRQRLHLGPERLDQRILLVMRERRQLGKPVHPKLESKVQGAPQALRQRQTAGPSSPGMSRYATGARCAPAERHDAQS
jgi:hypothetical protein